MAPIPPEQGQSLFACLDCMRKNGLYCDQHHRQHMGFWDGTTACDACIAEELDDQRATAEIIYVRLSNGLGEAQIDDLRGMAELVQMTTRLSIETEILRFLITTAKRLKISSDAVIERLIREQDTTFVLGPAYLMIG